MKDYLQDIVQHTHGLGVIDLAKIKCSEGVTELEALDTINRLVIVKAKFHNPIAEFKGRFGLPNLGKLNTVLNIPEYREDSKISVTEKDDGNGNFDLDGIKFENKNGDFHNVYRLMKASIVDSQMPDSRQVKEPTWNVTFTPTNASIQKLKFQASANSEETSFVAKTDGNDLKFFFGDHSSHAGDFVFHANANGKVQKGWKWPVGVVMSILALPGDKTYRICDDGLTEIIVDSGLAEYIYKIPALTK